MSQYMKHMPIKHKEDMSGKVVAPMPGVVKSVAVSVGQRVSECVVNILSNNRSFNNNWCVLLYCLLNASKLVCVGI